MFNGVYTALVTPFDSSNQIDRITLTDLVDQQIENGISGLVPVGTTGESPTLSHEENMDVVEMVVKTANGRVPVIAGTGSNSTEEAVRMTRIAKHIGADATLQVAPYYNKPTQEGLYRHYMTLADTIDLPLVVYNVPGRSGVNISVDTLIRLAEHPNIVAVKEASGNINQMMDIIRRKPGDFSVLSGDDALAFPLCAVGGNGVISVASNIIPRWMEDMVQAAVKGDMEKGRALHYDLLPLFKAMFLETNPIPVKAAMGMLGRITESYRLPLCPLAEENRKALKETLKDQGLL